ncbi:hypothetical protein DYB38_002882 [Aphanomyces astaci]|uniref:Mannosyltransferase n=1 Tax=Aphanomyces astaci TaxID=112090 RepID=A0A397C9F7_APHAT|nr:hypothetical protein DYB38_002882 [Aphanomyces astaci]
MWLRRGYYGGGVLRVLCVLSMGMVHPDEFFQCPEVMAKSVFGLSHAFIPWEYQLPLPNRSVLFPSVVAGLPYSVWKALGFDANGVAFLLLPRLVLLALSFVYDVTIAMLCRRVMKVDPWGPLFAFSTSWTSWTLLTRPFSNTCESFLLLLSFVLLFHRAASTSRTALLGMTLALGTFTRFTFILFFLPLGLYLVWDNDQDMQLVASKKSSKVSGAHGCAQGHATSAVPLPRRLGGVAHTAAVGAASFAVTCVAIILLDTLYFHDGILPSSSSGWVVAPWNNLVYNLDPSHLAEHGLHPRTNHWLVNMPLLFGPLVVLFVFQLVQYLTNLHSNATPPFHVMCMAAVVVPVTALSLAPHQEARFLLPVVLPLVLVTPLGTSRRLVLALWVGFNLALGLWFGVLHQGSVVPMLLSSGGSLALNPFCRSSKGGDLYTEILTTGTYMPPRFALSPLNVPLHDTPLPDLHAALATQKANDVTRVLLLVYPDPVAAKVDAILQSLDAHRTPMWTCWPFLSTETPPNQIWNSTEWTLHAHTVTWT